MKKGKNSIYRPLTRRQFSKNILLGAGSIGMGLFAQNDLLEGHFSDEFSRAFKHDAPKTLWKWSREASFYTAMSNGVRCELCPHECLIGRNDRGYCRGRVNKGNKLYSVVYGNPTAYHVDPVEKKPLFHFLPGSGIFSIATAGCNLRCNNCQNWQISQSKPEETRNIDLFPSEVVEATAMNRCHSVAYTYSEPIIFYEYVYDTATLARERNIKNVLVTAGYIHEKPLRKLAKVTDAANVDMKGFSDEFYIKTTGGRMGPVLRAMEVLREEGVWVEITNLVVPTLNDDPPLIKKLCEWIVKTLGPDVPLHFSRFHADFKLQHLPPTPIDTLQMAREIAWESGLRYVYIGNAYGHNFEDTLCPKDGEAVITRRGYTITGYELDARGRCKRCGTSVPGVWQG